MELSYDWRGFQALFSPRTSGPADESPQPVYVVSENAAVVAAFSEGDDVSEWIGIGVEEMKAQLGHREIFVFDRHEVDEWIQSSLTLPHYFEQVGFLRSRIQEGDRKKAHGRPEATHFLLEGLQTWWSQVLPSTYGIYVRLEGKPERSFFLLFRRGRLDAFHAPDLSSMIPERRKDPSDVVRFLSEQYHVPVQGLFVSGAEWEEWSRSGKPWNEILSGIKAKKARIYPSKLGMRALVWLRAHFGV